MKNTYDQTTKRYMQQEGLQEDKIEAYMITITWFSVFQYATKTWTLKKNYRRIIDTLTI